MSQTRKVTLIVLSVLFVSWTHLARADEVPVSAIAGSWIADVGPNLVKAVISYAPMGGGKFTAVESVFNFDWSLGGLKPTVTHATTLSGLVEKDKKEIDFVLIGYALDDTEKAVYILKAVGNKVLVDKDTISVENLVFQIYNDPETANPVTDAPDFTIPSSGTFPPFLQYRIK